MRIHKVTMPNIKVKPIEKALEVLYNHCYEMAVKVMTMNNEIEDLKDKHLDKAGGYAIQGMADKYFKWIRGSYTNVVGFPVEAVRKILKEIC